MFLSNSTNLTHNKMQTLTFLLVASSNVDPRDVIRHIGLCLQLLYTLTCFDASRATRRKSKAVEIIDAKSITACM